MAKHKKVRTAHPSSPSSASSSHRGLGIGAIVLALLAVTISIYMGKISTPQTKLPKLATEMGARKAAAGTGAEARETLADIGGEEECAQQMLEGKCEMDAATQANCKQTCAAAPLSAQCAGWAKLGYCELVSAFMLVHCPGVCARERNTCKRSAPGDLNEQCAAWAAAGHCERNWARGYRYFMAECFVSCGRRNPRLLLQAMLQEQGDRARPFPSGLADVAKEVGSIEEVRVDDPSSSEGVRVVRVERLHDSPRVRVLHNLISEQEVQELVAAGTPLLQPSPTMSAYRATVRTSSTA